MANRKHDMVAIQVYDRRETELPAVGLMKIKGRRDREGAMDRQFLRPCARGL